MAALVVGDPGAVLLAQHDLALGSEQHLLDGLQEVPHGHRVAVLPGREERRLVDQVFQVGADEAWSLRGELVEVHVGCQRDVLRVDLEDRGPSGSVRRLHHHAPVEASRPEQGRVQNVRAVGGGQHDHALA